MINYIKNIFNTYRNEPKFVFGFHGELSHDSYNDVGVADEDVYNWLKDLQAEGHLNNTILIMMSDHGQRYKEKKTSIHFLFIIFYTSNNHSLADLQRYEIHWQASRKRDCHFFHLHFHTGSSKFTPRHMPTLSTTQDSCQRLLTFTKPWNQF